MLFSDTKTNEFKANEDDAGDDEYEGNDSPTGEDECPSCRNILHGSTYCPMCGWSSEVEREFIYEVQIKIEEFCNTWGISFGGIVPVSLF